VNVTTLRKSLERIMTAIVVIDGNVLAFMISHVTTVMIGHVTTVMISRVTTVMIGHVTTVMISRVTTVMVQTRTTEGGSSTLMEITAVANMNMPSK
jgi:hypothetical protein